MRFRLAILAGLIQITLGQQYGTPTTAADPNAFFFGNYFPGYYIPYGSIDTNWFSGFYGQPQPRVEYEYQVPDSCSVALTWQGGDAADASSPCGLLAVAFRSTPIISPTIIIFNGVNWTSVERAITNPDAAASLRLNLAGFLGDQSPNHAYIAPNGLPFADGPDSSFMANFTVSIEPESNKLGGNNCTTLLPTSVTVNDVTCALAP